MLFPRYRGITKIIKLRVDALPDQLFFNSCEKRVSSPCSQSEGCSASNLPTMACMMVRRMKSDLLRTLNRLQ